MFCEVPDLFTKIYNTQQYTNSSSNIVEFNFHPSNRRSSVSYPNGTVYRGVLGVDKAFLSSFLQYLPTLEIRIDVDNDVM
jgi:hypothetical protein